jgi:hypothetical protein
MMIGWVATCHRQVDPLSTTKQSGDTFFIGMRAEDAPVVNFVNQALDPVGEKLCIRRRSDFPAS